MAKVVTAFDRVCIVRGLRCSSVTYSRYAPSSAPCPAGAAPVSVLRGTFTTGLLIRAGDSREVPVQRRPGFLDSASNGVDVLVPLPDLGSHGRAYGALQARQNLPAGVVVEGQPAFDIDIDRVGVSFGSRISLDPHGHPTALGDPKPFGMVPDASSLRVEIPGDDPSVPHDLQVPDRIERAPDPDLQLQTAGWSPGK